MSQILFLDIDGVLNCRKSKTFYDLDHPEKYSIDEDLWNNLEIFLKKFPKVKVVIHSGWIKHYDEPNYEWDMGHPENGVKIKTLLPTVVSRLGDRYIGHVPYLKGKPKSSRIEQWLSDNMYFNEDYKAIVLDDDKSEWTNILDLEKYPNVYVHFTNTETGLDSMSLLNLIEKCEVIFR